MNTQTQNNDHPNLNNAQTADNADATPPRPASLRVPARVGKIARLPRPIRDELNHRLDNGESADTLLPWLNNLPETKKVLETQFSDQPVNKQNLSDWRHGGFAEWQLRQQLEDDVLQMSCHADDLEKRPCQFIADHLVTALTARYAALLIRWDGEATPEMDTKIKLYSRLRRDLTALQQSTHWASQRSEERVELEKKKELQRIDEERRKKLNPHFAALNRSTAFTKYDRINTNLENALKYGTPFPFYEDDEIQAPPKSQPVAPKNSGPAPASAPQPSTPQPSTNASQAQSSQLVSTPAPSTISKPQNPPIQQNPPVKTPANPPANEAIVPTNPPIDKPTAPENLSVPKP